MPTARSPCRKIHALGGDAVLLVVDACGRFDEMNALASCSRCAARLAIQLMSCGVMFSSGPR